MDKIKDKYEILLGFATLAISLSAFKDELKKVTFDLGYSQNTNLADYFLICIVCFSICLYFYVFEVLFKDSLLDKGTFLTYAVRFGYFVFRFTILSPFFLLLNIYIVKGINTYYDSSEESKSELASLIINILTIISTALTASYSTWKYILTKRELEKQVIETQEILELSKALKLFEDGYYSETILECFKVVETHLYKRLFAKDIRVSRHKIQEIIELSLKYKIISQEDIPAINDIRGMRNSAAHTDSQFTKDHAHFAIEFIKKLIKTHD